uniref:cysteine desulfurase, mitochondrial-like isoform X2 n=1 Tax=Styela clava TaxID=7725 RepID=UPI00193A3217|nr:cysteine desulfurase, mitochondrial-like isoform X2 [Styela clava]
MHSLLRKSFSLTNKYPLFTRHSSSSSHITQERKSIAQATIEKGHGEWQPGFRPVYLDVQATAPMDPRVLDSMLPYFVSYYGNPHSRTHAYGWQAEDAVEDARKQVASLINADPREIIFTSGATECNNIAVKGVGRFYKSKKRHIITTQIEHKCVLDSCRSMESEGIEVTYLPVQAVGKIPIDVNEMKIDLMSISGHKIYGPKGVGGLFLRRRPRVRVEPLQSGGGQERGVRSGTVPTPLIIGFGTACALCQEEMEYDHERISYLSHRLESRIREKLSHVIRNGDVNQTYPGCLNLSFAYVEGESLLMALKDVALSSGSACTSASLEPSYVLRAIGADDDLAHSSIRFGIGRFTTEAEIDYAADNIIDQVTRLRELSPLWEMAQEGIDLKTIEWTQH